MASPRPCHQQRRSAAALALAFGLASYGCLCLAGALLGSPVAFSQWLSPASSRPVAAKANTGAVVPLRTILAGCRAGALPSNGRLEARTAARAAALLYATQTGNTEEVAGMIAEATGLTATDVGDLEASDLEGFDGLVVGCPTWNTDADEYRSGTAWDDIIDEIKGLSLAGKPVAVFGCGDSQSYSDNFCDGIEELHNTFAAAGAKSVGYVDASGYSYSESKSVRDGKFLGLPLDQDNEAEESEGRIQAWVAQIKSEGMPL